MRHLVSCALPLLLLATPALAQTNPPAGCGAATVVQPNDTLSSIAERCDVSEAAILRANPAVEGSGDLRRGASIALSNAQEQPLDRLERAAESAGSELLDVARDAGSAISSSVGRALEERPDLNRRIRDLGEQVGISGRDVARAEVTIDPAAGAPGTTVAISAVGLPENAPVLIGGGTPARAYEVLQEARTEPDGTLRATVQIPPEAAGTGRYRLSIRGADSRWKAQAPLFEVSR